MGKVTKVSTYKNYINGEWIASSNEQVEASINPANKIKIVGYVQKSPKEDLDKAVAAAKKAQARWRKLSGGNPNLENGSCAYLWKHSCV